MDEPLKAVPAARSAHAAGVSSVARQLLLAIALFASSGSAWVQPACTADRYGNPACPPAGGQCTADRYGNPVCSPADGGVATNRVGEIVCGRGACVTDVHGEVMCSSVPRGAATLDRYGKAACTEGCEAGSVALCVRPR